MSPSEPRPVARHRMRHRFPRVVRPYPVVVSILVTLASVPVFAAVLAGSATLTTTATPRAPILADEPQGPPVVVPRRPDVTAPPASPVEADAAASGPVSTTPPATPEPVVTPEVAGDVAPSTDVVTVPPRPAPRDGSAPVGAAGTSPWRRAPQPVAPGSGGSEQDRESRPPAASRPGPAPQPGWTGRPGRPGASQQPGTPGGSPPVTPPAPGIGGIIDRLDDLLSQLGRLLGEGRTG
ncbi:hypothetical protein ACNTMW_10120 [Planosporangium sp. 12N6]|uniref:hypothetical protein n=1 Tax=Planosporangium spinosum TaxID=3402278 RepID=UPI003CFA6387